MSNYITIRSGLIANEDTRRYVWHLMAEQNTPLINELLQTVSLHSDFETWRKRGTLPKNAVKQICDPLRQDPRFAGQPGRFYTSAEKTVQWNYEAWLESHKNKQAKLEGKRRWSEILESDIHLAEICSASPETVSAKAGEILELVSASLSSDIPSVKQSKKEKKSQKKNALLIGQLFELLNTTDDPLNRRTIIHLLKHGGKVSEQEEEPEELLQQLARIRKQIHRLEEQLQARTPKGRASSVQDAEEKLMEAISLPEHPGLMLVLQLTWALLCDPEPSVKYKQFIFTYLLRRVCQFEEARLHFEFLDWAESFTANRLNLTRSPNPLPYPILFGAEDVVKWSRNEKGRICLSFNGLAKDHLFEVQCDRRQLPLFELFLEDWQTLRAKETKGQYSGSFLLLREASLLWQEPKRVVKKKNKQHFASQVEPQPGDKLTLQRREEISAPWNRYRLALHCVVEVQSLTIEGTEKIRQEKLLKRKKELEDRTAKSSANQNQSKTLHREQSKQTTLENAKHFRRSQRPLYQGNPDILIGVSFNLAAPATVAVVRGSTGETLTFRSVRQLLGENYRLLNRQQQKRRKHGQQRCKHQQKGKFEQPSESELGLYIDRLIAKAIIALAKQHQASSIIIPDLKGTRERVQSEVEAKAERKSPGSREAQTLYAKQYRKQIHKWSHGRLAQNIRSQAAKVGIQVETGYQPFQGSPQEKARDLAIACYHARQLSS